MENEVREYHGDGEPTYGVARSQKPEGDLGVKRLAELWVIEDLAGDANVRVAT